MDKWQELKDYIEFRLEITKGEYEMYRKDEDSDDPVVQPSGLFKVGCRARENICDAILAKMQRLDDKEKEQAK